MLFRSENCDVLIIEGVSVSFREFDEEEAKDEITDEPMLIERINALVRENPDKQITFNYYISNVERAYNIIKTNPRKVVLDAYYAYVVKEATGLQSYYYQFEDKDYGLDTNYKVDFKTLLEDESEYFWQLDGKALDYMEDMKKGGIYIHSNAAPMIESDPAYKPFVDRFAACEIEMIKLACSGHAHPNDLMRLIGLVKPKLLVPIHSFRPEKLTNESGDRLLPEKGQTI